MIDIVRALAPGWTVLDTKVVRKDSSSLTVRASLEATITLPSPTSASPTAAIDHLYLQRPELEGFRSKMEQLIYSHGFIASLRDGCSGADAARSAHSAVLSFRTATLDWEDGGPYHMLLAARAT